MFHPSRKLGLAIGLFAGLLLFAGSASAQSATGTANATILEALTLGEDIQLEFGRILAGPGGTVDVTQAGGQTCTGPTCFADAVAAQFTVTGTGLETVDVTVDATVTLSGPGPNMTATTDAPATVAIAAGGSSTFNVGGTLTVGAAPGQTAGDYSGTYNISVAYQ